MHIVSQLVKISIYLYAFVNRSPENCFIFHILMCEQLTNSQRISFLKLQDFQVEAVLGKGSYGFVLLAVRDRQEYALKEMSKYRLKKFHKQYIALVEKELLRKVTHPGIISAYGAFQTHSKLYIVLEACKGGEFQQFVKRGISQDARRFYFAQLVNIVEYLHSNGIVHRDLKPSNLLLTEQGHLKMIDFGTACVVNCTLVSEAFKDSLSSMRNEKENIQQQLQESHKIRKRKSTFVGTSEYMSPQLLELNECQATSDLWSLGCILYFLYYVRGPFYDVCELDLYKKIRYGKVNFPKNQLITDEVEDLIRKLLILTPEQRLGSGFRQDLTFKVLKAHPFFKGINVGNIYSQKPPAYLNPEIQIESRLTQLNNAVQNSVSVSDKCLLTLFLAKKKYNIYIIYRCQFYSDFSMKQFQQKYPQKIPIMYKLKKQEGQYNFVEDICPGKIKLNIQTQQDQSKMIYRTTDSALHSARINQFLLDFGQLESSLEKMQISLQ